MESNVLRLNFERKGRRAKTYPKGIAGGHDALLQKTIDSAASTAHKGTLQESPGYLSWKCVNLSAQLGFLLSSMMLESGQLLASYYGNLTHLAHRSLSNNQHGGSRGRTPV
jgi:hypothetical protein